jgi:hypothetical protein
VIRFIFETPELISTFPLSEQESFYEDWDKELKEINKNTTKSVCRGGGGRGSGGRGGGRRWEWRQEGGRRRWKEVEGGGRRWKEVEGGGRRWKEVEGGGMDGPAA